MKQPNIAHSCKLLPSLSQREIRWPVKAGIMLSLSNGSWSHEKRWSHCQRRKMRNTLASSPLFPPSNLQRQLEAPEQKPGNSLGRWVSLLWCRAEQQKPKQWIWGQKVLMSPAMGGPEFLPLLAPVHTQSALESNSAVVSSAFLNA